MGYNIECLNHITRLVTQLFSPQSWTTIPGRSRVHTMYTTEITTYTLSNRNTDEKGSHMSGSGYETCVIHKSFSRRHVNDSVFVRKHITCGRDTG